LVLAPTACMKQITGGLNKQISDVMGAGPIETVAARCEKGEMTYCNVVGHRYRAGTDAPKDWKLAANYYTIGCQGGEESSCESLYEMGFDYFYGKTQKQDYGLAIKLLQVSCHSDYGPACTTLGNAYEDGKGVKKNWAKALELYILGCNNGSSDGCRYAGDVYLKNEPAKAKAFYERGCKRDNPHACAKLGDFYLKGKIVKRDCGKAYECFLKSCDNTPSRNVTEGCFALAGLYEQGLGVPKDKSKAVKYYRFACYLTRPKKAEACIKLAQAYQTGEGIEKNANSAHEYFDQACRLGSKQGCIAKYRDECRRLKIPNACNWLKTHGRGRSGKK